MEYFDTEKHLNDHHYRKENSQGRHETGTVSGTVTGTFSSMSKPVSLDPAQVAYLEGKKRKQLLQKLIIECSTMQIVNRQ